MFSCVDNDIQETEQAVTHDDYELIIDNITDALDEILEHGTNVDIRYSSKKGLNGDIFDHFDSTMEELGYQNYFDNYSKNFELYSEVKGDNRFNTLLEELRQTSNISDIKILINDELSSYEVINDSNFEEVLKLEVALVLSDHIDFFQDNLFKGWRCGFAVAGAFLTGGLAGAWAGAEIGTLLSAPSGPGVAAGATAGAIIGGIVGGIGGALTTHEHASVCN